VAVMDPLCVDAIQRAIENPKPTPPDSLDLALGDFELSQSVTWLDESGVTEAKSGGGPGMVEGPDTGGGTGTTGQPGGEGPENGFPGDMFGDLDEETLEKVQNIMEQGRQGTITREEAQAQLE
jgi:hypothetical protein